MQRSSRKIFTALFACRRNADLNLTLVTRTTNGFIFQIINSLIESWEYALPALIVSFGEGYDYCSQVMIRSAQSAARITDRG